MMDLLVPYGYTLRALRPADDDSAITVEAASETASDGSPDPAMASGVRQTWSMPGFDRERDSWAVVAPDGRIAGFAHLSPTDRAHHYSHGYVHPEHTGRGIGSLLLRLTDARALERLATARVAGESGKAGEDTGERVTLQQWLSARNPAAQALFVWQGYAVVRHLWGMTIDFAHEPVPAAWPDGMSVRTCDGERDLRAAHAITEDAFRDHWEHEPRTFEQFRASMIDIPTFDPTLWFLAMDGETPIGSAQCELLPDQGWVNTIGVVRSWRGRGVASALLRHAFGEFYRRGMRKAGLGVDAQNPTGATRVYERAGMRVERQYDIYEKVLCDGKEC